ncbi:MAG TPA: pilin [Candidatus Paceibacterota bacterium]|nr:pilin [Candidatus Paceibacterota bacterium]
MIRNRFLSIISHLLVFTVLVLPLAALGADEEGKLIPCGKDALKPCTFGDLITLGNNIIDFLLKVLALPLAIITIAWAGLKYTFRGSNPGERGKANMMLKNTIIGLVLALSSFLIVKFVIVSLTNDSEIGTALKNLFNSTN